MKIDQSFGVKQPYWADPALIWKKKTKKQQQQKTETTTTTSQLDCLIYILVHINYYVKLTTKSKIQSGN